MNPNTISVVKIEKPGRLYWSVSHPNLPLGFYCYIDPCPRGTGFFRKTRANGKGSTRYHVHVHLEDAIKAGKAWVRRKLREAEKAPRVVKVKPVPAVWFFEEGK